jgi:hypothetical protein
MGPRDRVAAILFLVLGGYVLLAGIRLSIGSLQKPGAGFQPFVLGLAFIALASVYLVTAVQGKGDAAPAWPPAAWRRPILASGAVLFYWLGLTRLGFPAATLLFLLYWLWVVERESWRRVLLVSVGTTAGLYLVFTLILRIRLPLGTLF